MDVVQMMINKETRPKNECSPQSPRDCPNVNFKEAFVDACIGGNIKIVEMMNNKIIQDLTYVIPNNSQDQQVLQQIPVNTFFHSYVPYNYGSDDDESDFSQAIRQKKPKIKTLDDTYEDGLINAIKHDHCDVVLWLLKNTKISKESTQGCYKYAKKDNNEEVIDIFRDFLKLYW